MVQLQGKVAVVTGAASGMGKEIARLFVAEGSSIVVADWNAEGGQQTVAEITSNGGTASFFHVDVSQAAQVKAMIDFAVRQYGTLDILVNNAGIALMGKDGPVGEVTEETWDRVLAVNLKSVYLGMHYAIPVFLQKGGGVIVNTASIAGLVGFPSLAAYCASKGGIIQLTKAAALDYGRHHIRANAICPGVVVTAMTRDMLADPATKKGLDEATVIGRLGKPEDIAQAALYLASDASSFVTGIALVVDGGWTAH